MDRIDVIRNESERFAEVLAGTDPATPCPTCPDWRAGDLLWHLTEVHLFWAGILATNARTDEDSEAVDQDKPDRPDTNIETLALRAEATAKLLAQLSALDDAEPRWSWWEADQTVGFTRRMQTYEALMHRVDAELTAGLPLSPIDSEVAAGAVDHCVDVMWGWLPENMHYEPLTVAKFVASDTGQTWLVEVGHWFGTGQSGKVYDVPRAVRASDVPAEVSVTAPVEQLALWAWGRGGKADVTGDPTAVAAVQALIAQGIQ